MSFDPSAHKDPPVFGALKAGKYILAMTSFERKESREGAPYLRARFVAIGGPSKGSFFAGVSLNTEKPVSMQRLSAYCRAIGHTTPFDLESDLQIAKALIGKPFVANVSYSKTRSGDREYENNDIKEYLHNVQWSDDMRHQAQEWVSANRDKIADLSKYSDDSGDMGGGGGFGGGFDSGSSSGMDFGDDDIPF
jgi:hypothetical protein